MVRVNETISNIKHLKNLFHYSRDLQDSLDPLEEMVCLVDQDFPVLQDQLESLVRMVTRANLDLLEKRVLKETRDPWDLLVLWVQGVLLAIRELLDQLETKALLEKWEDKALKVKMVLGDC